jgi:hypothetical protein
MEMICSKKKCGQKIEYGKNACTIICPSCKTVYYMMTDSKDLVRVKGVLYRAKPKIKMNKNQRRKHIKEKRLLREETYGKSNDK